MSNAQVIAVFAEFLKDPEFRTFRTDVMKRPALGPNKDKKEDISTDEKKNPKAETNPKDKEKPTGENKDNEDGDLFEAEQKAKNAKGG